MSLISSFAGLHDFLISKGLRDERHDASVFLALDSAILAQQRILLQGNAPDVCSQLVTQAWVSTLSLLWQEVVRSDSKVFRDQKKCSNWYSRFSQLVLLVRLVGYSYVYGHRRLGQSRGLSMVADRSGDLRIQRFRRLVRHLAKVGSPLVPD